MGWLSDNVVKPINNAANNLKPKAVGQFQNWMNEVGDDFAGNTARREADKAKAAADRAKGLSASGFDQEELQRQKAESDYMSGRNKAIDTYKTERGMQDIREDSLDRAGYKRVATQEGQFQREQGELNADAKKAAEDATAAYKSDVRPRIQNLMEKAQTDADNAMTLQQYQDPNNQVAQRTRALYEQQANNTRQQGLADYGVMAALGQNAAAGAMQGPMTAGQQFAMLAQGNRQASEAFANTQRRMAALRDMGLEKGFEQSDKAYQAGLGRQRDLAGLADQLNAADMGQQQMQQGFRAERGGYVNNMLGSRQRDTDAFMGSEGNILGRKRSNINSDLARQLAIGQEDLGFAQTRQDRAAGQRQFLATGQLQQANNDLNAAIAQQNSRNQLFGSLLGAAGTIGGAMVGGAPGAMAGNAAAQIATPQQQAFVSQPVPQYQSSFGVYNGMQPRYYMRG